MYIYDVCGVNVESRIKTNTKTSLLEACANQTNENLDIISYI